MASHVIALRQELVDILEGARVAFEPIRSTSRAVSRAVGEMHAQGLPDHLVEIPQWLSRSGIHLRKRRDARPAGPRSTPR